MEALAQHAHPFSGELDRAPRRQESSASDPRTCARRLLASGALHGPSLPYLQKTSENTSTPPQEDRRCPARV